MTAFAIRGLGLAAPGEQDLTILPRPLRRGLSELMRLAISAAGRALASARVEAGELPIVFGSAFGETGTALELLGAIAKDGAASPALFRHSVHNAAPGLTSIALGSGASATAIAAGDETLLATLLETTALFRAGATRVLVVVADEGVPARLAPRLPYRAGAVAWLLGEAEAPALGYLGAPALAPGAGVESARDPLVPAFALAAATQKREARAVALSPRSVGAQVWRARAATTAEACA